jgi:tetratricopeptide (TPR) repeat protein
MRFCQLLWVLGALAALAPLRGAGALPAADLKGAIALFDAHRYPEARAAFESIVAAQPQNAAAAYYLGRSIEPRADANALPEAIKWYEKAATLEPENATYLARFGGASLILAGRTHSYFDATRGRDAMEKAVKLNPNDLDAREGLFQFYHRAPWPIGSSAKAAAQLEEIRKRDPARGTILSVLMKTANEDFAGAFQLCNEVLAKNPADYTALYHYGRTAALSGQNLEAGLKALQKCVTLPQPSPASPSPSNAWNRIGDIEQKLHHAPAARTAYETALKLDPNNVQAAAALAALK